MKINKKLLYIIIFVPIWFLWLFLGTDLMFGLAAGGFFIILSIITYKLIKKYDKKLKTLSGKIFLIITLLIIISIYPIHLIQVNKSKAIAFSIINKIEIYKTENGNYPKKLSQLVPNYITKLPYSSMGIFIKNKYLYYMNDEKGFYKISFPNILFTTLVYSSETKQWSISD